MYSKAMGPWQRPPSASRHARKLCVRSALLRAMMGSGVCQGAMLMADATNPLPTEEGKRRFEPDGLYDGIPCTCLPTCEYPCGGKCGCEACRAERADVMSSRE